MRGSIKPCLHVSRLEENIPEDRRQEWFDEDRDGFSWRNTLRYCATDQRLRPVGTFIPRSTRRRSASEREGLSGCRAAQASISATFSSDNRNVLMGSRPVAGRPIFFFGITFCIDIAH